VVSTSFVHCTRFRLVCPAMAPRPATNDYIDRIVTPAARKYGFPSWCGWYLERLESFRP
jgi:hypothetical protein